MAREFYQAPAHGRLLRGRARGTASAGALLVVLAVTLISPEEPVRFLEAYDIGAACRDEQNPVSSEICYAFLLGVAQAQAAASAPPAYCLPDGVKRGELMSAVRRHIRRAPGALDRPAGEFVIGAFVRAFPCS